MKLKFSTYLLSVLMLIGCLSATNSFATTMQPGTKLRVFFIQTAKAAKLTTVQGKSNTYTLKMRHVDPYLSFLADRPKRISGLITINDLLKIWNYGPNNFSNTHPNVAIESTLPSKMPKGQMKKISILGTLSYPKYNSKNDSMTYTLTTFNTKLPQTTTIKLGYTVIFIDSALIHWNPGGFGA